MLPIAGIREAREFTLEQKLPLHLDGARIWNASVASGVSLGEYGAQVDSISACFSKGLGAPVGSVIAGSRPFIEEARRYRKIFGGGMRQAGILAAAALYAIDHNIDRLAEDHENAKLLARELEEVPAVEFCGHGCTLLLLWRGLGGRVREDGRIPSGRWADRGRGDVHSLTIL